MELAGRKNGRLSQPAIKKKEEPIMPETYDVIVLGTGVSGTTASFQLAEAGKKVGVADEREFGGTCPLRGCDPKKVLAGAAEIMHRFSQMENHGLAGDPVIDWNKLIAFKRTFTQPFPRQLEQSMQEAGIDTLHGQAEFSGKNTLRVKGKEFTFRHCVIATGAKPRPLDIPGKELLTTSELFMETDQLPKRIIFMGGGFISFEFAHIASRSGAEPLILHRSEQVLKQFDPDLTDTLLNASREAGIELKTNQTVTAVQKSEEGLTVSTEKGDTFNGDMVVHGAGRVPKIDKLNPAAAGIETGKRGIRVNAHLQSVSNPLIYAVGDAAGLGLPQTPVATVQGGMAAHNIIHGPEEAFDSLTTPSVIFTLPVMTKVGLLEAEAREQNLDIEVGAHDMSSWYNSRRIGLKHAACKTVVEKGSGKILGAHMLGHHAEEVINLFALAIQYNLTRDQLIRLPYSYPTAGYDIRNMF